MSEDEKSMAKAIDSHKPDWMSWTQWAISSHRAQVAGELYAAGAVAAYFAHQLKIAHSQADPALPK